MKNTGKTNNKTVRRAAAFAALSLSAVLLMSSCAQDGLSAYELAVKNGLTGLSESQWLESLKGENGKDGRDGENGQNGASAYELAVAAGFKGTAEEWLASLRGKDGAAGKSAYQSAVENGYTGSEGDWVAAIMGSGSQTGTAGVGIASVQVNSARHLIVRLTNGTVIDAGYIGVSDGNGGNSGSDTPAENIDADGYLVVNQTVAVTAGALNIRTAPNTTDSKVVTYLTMGTELVRVGIGRDGNKWSKVLYNGQVCYASSAYLEVVSDSGSVDLGALEIPAVRLCDTYRLMVGQQMAFEAGQFMERTGEGYTVSFSYTGSGKKYVTSDAIYITPTAAETAELTVTLRKTIDGRPVVVYTKTVKLISESRANVNLTALVIGDSRISDGTLVNRLKSTWGSSMTLIGTKKTASGTAHEGRGAWSTSNYLSYATAVKQDNPFYNPAKSEFDFDYYLKNNSLTCPDLVVFYLGANDGYSALSITNYQKLIDSVKAAGTTRGKQVRVFIMMEYLAPEDGFCLGYSFDAASMRHDQAVYFDRLTKAFGSREGEGIYLIPAGVVIDSGADRVREQVRVSDYSDAAEDVITDVVHLSKVGYTKQADVISAYVNSIFAVK